MMVNKGNHPQMALIQVSEILLFTQKYRVIWQKKKIRRYNQTEATKRHLTNRNGEEFALDAK